MGGAVPRSVLRNRGLGLCREKGALHRFEVKEDHLFLAIAQQSIYRDRHTTRREATVIVFACGRCRSTTRQPSRPISKHVSDPGTTPQISRTTPDLKRPWFRPAHPRVSPRIPLLPAPFTHFCHRMGPFVYERIRRSTFLERVGAYDGLSDFVPG